MLRGCAVLISVCVAGCVGSSAVTCGDGVTCPADTTCVELTNPSQQLCATAEQIAACKNVAEGSACTDTALGSNAGACHGGACLEIACGDGRVDTGEVCDDNNTKSGDGCSADCKSDETCGNGIVDPLKEVNGMSQLNEECDDGNRLSGDGCSSNCALETPRWEQLDTSGPPAIDGAAVAYDPVRKRVVMFGGHYIDAGNNDVLLDQTWEWDGNGWLRVPVTLAPNGRRDARMVYHPGLRRIVMYGGRAGGVSDINVFRDVWLWDGNRWELAGGNPPPGRIYHGMVYDAARKKVVVFGGIVSVADVTKTPPQSQGKSDNTVYEWDGTTWTMATAPLEARDSFVMVYDPKRGKVIVAGGHDGTYPQNNGTPTTVATPDTWEYDGTWHQVTTADASQLDSAEGAYDPSGGNVIAFGGAASNSTWQYDGTTWTDLVNSTPLPRSEFAAVSDLANNEIMMYGGHSPTNESSTLGDLWLWSSGSWTSPPAPQVSQSPFDMATAYDPLTGLNWRFGGTHVPPNSNSSAGVGTTELWSWNGTSWTLHGSVTGGPSQRGAAVAAYDAMHHNIVVFGGAADGAPTLAPNDTWLWDGTTWKNANPAHSPPAREFTSMTYDPSRGRIVMYGGVSFDASGVVGLADLWEWDGTDWQQVTAANSPGPLAAAIIGYTPKLGVVIGMGLGAISPSNPFVSDMWSWDGTVWKQREMGSPLPLRAFPSMSLPQPRDRALLFGGFTLNSSAYDDTWEWDGTSWSQVATLARPQARFGNASMLDRSGGDVLIFGGSAGHDSGPFLLDTWRLRYDSDAPREQCELNVDNDLDGLSGCKDPDCWTTCSPLCPPGAPCDASAPKCGDGVCNAALENCRNCPGDCACTPVCGDTFCEGNETHMTCPGDCP